MNTKILKSNKAGPLYGKRPSIYFRTSSTLFQCNKSCYNNSQICRTLDAWGLTSPLQCVFYRHVPEVKLNCPFVMA